MATRISSFLRKRSKYALSIVSIVGFGFGHLSEPYFGLCALPEHDNQVLESLQQATSSSKPDSSFAFEISKNQAMQASMTPTQDPEDDSWLSFLDLNAYKAYEKEGESPLKPAQPTQPTELLRPITLDLPKQLPRWNPIGGFSQREKVAQNINIRVEHQLPQLGHSKANFGSNSARNGCSWSDNKTQLLPSKEVVKSLDGVPSSPSQSSFVMYEPTHPPTESPTMSVGSIGDHAPGINHPFRSTANPSRTLWNADRWDHIISPRVKRPALAAFGSEDLPFRIAPNQRTTRKELTFASTPELGPTLSSDVARSPQAINDQWVGMNSDPDLTTQVSWWPNTSYSRKMRPENGFNHNRVVAREAQPCRPTLVPQLEPDLSSDLIICEGWEQELRETLKLGQSPYRYALFGIVLNNLKHRSHGSKILADFTPFMFPQYLMRHARMNDDKCFYIAESELETLVTGYKTDKKDNLSAGNDRFIQNTDRRRRVQRRVVEDVCQTHKIRTWIYTSNFNSEAILAYSKVLYSKEYIDHTLPTWIWLEKLATMLMVYLHVLESTILRDKANGPPSSTVDTRDQAWEFFKELWLDFARGIEDPKADKVELDSQPAQETVRRLSRLANFKREMPRNFDFNCLHSLLWKLVFWVLEDRRASLFEVLEHMERRETQRLFKCFINDLVACTTPVMETLL